MPSFMCRGNFPKVLLPVIHKSYFSICLLLFLTSNQNVKFLTNPYDDNLMSVAKQSLLFHVLLQYDSISTRHVSSHQVVSDEYWQWNLFLLQIFFSLSLHLKKSEHTVGYEEEEKEDDRKEDDIVSRSETSSNLTVEL